MIVKICGMTRLADAEHAAAHGATAVGFIFWPQSPRYIAPERAAAIVRVLPPDVTTVGVFVNQGVGAVQEAARTSGVSAIQLHGDEPAAYAEAFDRPVWRATSLATADAVLAEWPADTTFLVDAHDPVRRGGTGRAIDWDTAAAIAKRRRVVLAGGLTPENVSDAVGRVQPFGVDVSSGVESGPGVKDFDKVTRFLERARAAFNEH